MAYPISLKTDPQAAADQFDEAYACAVGTAIKSGSQYGHDITLIKEVARLLQVNVVQEKELHARLSLKEKLELKESEHPGIPYLPALVCSPGHVYLAWPLGVQMKVKRSFSYD